MRWVPQCGRIPVLLLLPRRRLLPPHPAPRSRPRAPRARARDVPRGRHRRRRGLDRSRSWRRHGPPQEAHDQQPRVRLALPRAQAGLRHPAQVGGAAPAAGEREAPRQVRAAEGIGGGAGAGEEDPAAGALGAVLISQEEQQQLPPPPLLLT